MTDKYSQLLVNHFRLACLYNCISVVYNMGCFVFALQSEQRVLLPEETFYIYIYGCWASCPPLWMLSAKLWFVVLLVSVLQCGEHHLAVPTCSLWKFRRSHCFFWIVIHDRLHSFVHFISGPLKLISNWSTLSEIFNSLDQ